MRHMTRILALTLISTMAVAEQLTVDMVKYTDTSPDQGQHLGQVLIQDSQFGGILITPSLKGLPVGTHGFHIHMMPSCASSMTDGHKVVAGAAGGHLDPAQTNMHAGPYGAGHLGDLPVLVVDEGGTASLPVLAPRLKLADLHGHTLMIHMNGDNYSDKPAANGGGGARFACGVIQ